MANMFSGKTNKQIPTSLNECTQEDATVSNLHTWAERLEAWGKVLFWFLVIGGIVLAIIASIQSTEVVHGTYYQWTETETTFNFALFFTSVAEIALYAFLEYCAYHVLALLISALASITQNTIISANVALYQAAKDSDNIQELNQENSPSQKIFSNNRTDSYSQTINRTVAPDGMWVCKNCGTNNSLNYSQCKK